MSCTVCNMSAEGAAIDVENPAFVPPQPKSSLLNPNRWAFRVPRVMGPDSVEPLECEGTQVQAGRHQAERQNQSNTAE